MSPRCVYVIASPHCHTRARTHAHAHTTIYISPKHPNTPLIFYANGIFKRRDIIITLTRSKSNTVLCVEVEN